VIKFFYYLILTFLGAVIVHICVLLLISTYAGSPIMARLETEGAAGQFFALAEDNPITLRLDPAFRLSACHFDLDDGPVHLTAQGDVPFWSLSLYDRDGSNLYSINSRVMTGGQLDLVVGQPIQMMDYRVNTTQTEGQGGNILTQYDIRRGFVMLRAYSPSSDWEPYVAEFLRSARCAKI